MRSAAQTDNYNVSGTELAYLVYSQAQSYAAMYQQIGMEYSVADVMAMSHTEYGTYGNYFIQTALIAAKENLVLAEYAKANGITLSDEDKEAIDTYIDSIAEAAASNFYSTNAYIKLMYGNGINESDIRKTLELQYLALTAREDLEEKVLKGQITDEKIKEYVENNVDTFYTVDYLSFALVANLEAENAEATDEEKLAFDVKKAELKALAEKLAQTKTEEEFKNIVREYVVNTTASELFDEVYTDDYKTDLLKDESAPTDDQLATDKAALLVKFDEYLKSLDSEDEAEDAETETAEETKYQKALNEIYDELVEKVATDYEVLTEGYAHYKTDAETVSESDKWLFDEATKAGDTKLITDGDTEDSKKVTYTVYMLKTPSHLDEGKTQNVAHLLVKFEEDDPSDEQKAAAKEEAEKLLAEFNAGSDKSKEAFEKFAEEHTDDSGVVYEYVAEGEMVAEFEDWIFDEARTEGETGIVETEYGYHIMFYIGEGDRLAWENDAHTGILTDLFNDWVEVEAPKVNFKSNDSVANAIQ